MKTFLCHVGRVLLIAGGFFPGLSTLRADLSATFTVPPYQLDASVLGIEGWQSRLPGELAPDETARVRAVRWNREAPALILRRASIKNAFPRTAGSRVQVTVKLAVTFPEGGQLHQVRVGFGNAPFGELFFDAGADGGFGYGGPGNARTGIIALPHDQVKLNSFYTYSILIDYDRQTYDLALTGTKRDGSALSYEAKGVGFTSKTNFLDSVFLITGQSVITYVAELSARSL